MLRKEIGEVLKTFDENVFYGRVSNDKLKELAGKTYIIYGSNDLSRKDNRSNDWIESYNVVICKDDHIDIDFIFSVIDSLQEIPKLNISNTPIDFRYIKLNDSDTIVTTATIALTQTIKRLDFDGA